MRFTAELLSTGTNTAGFVVPEAVVEGLAAGRRPKVVVTLQGHSWRSSIASMGGRMLLGVSVANRAVAGVAPGTTYDVEVVLDEAPREVDLPEGFAAALNAEPEAAAFWATLSYSAQRAFAEPIGQTTNPETAQRRIDKAMAALREGRKRP